MRAKTVSLETFKREYSWINILRMLPEEIYLIIEKCKLVNQREDYHPEKSVYNHVKIVYERALETGDITFPIAAIFHDLGKLHTTKISPKTGEPHSPGHEHISTKFVDKYKDWIESMDADFDVVRYIVSEHMRAHIINDMRPSKQEAMRNNPLYPKVKEFSKFDDMLTYDH